MNSGFHKQVPEGHWRLVFITFFAVGHLLLATTAYSERADTCAGAESRVLAATKALDQGTLDEAKRIFLEVQASHTQCADVLLGLGRIHTGWGMHLTPEAPRYGILALEGYSPTLGGLESASPSGFKFSPRRAATRRNEPQASAPRPPPGDFPRAQAAAVADHKI